MNLEQWVQVGIQDELDRRWIKLSEEWWIVRMIDWMKSRDDD